MASVIAENLQKIGSRADDLNGLIASCADAGSAVAELTLDLAAAHPTLGAEDLAAIASTMAACKQLVETLKRAASEHERVINALWSMQPPGAADG